MLSTLLRRFTVVALAGVTFAQAAPQPATPTASPTAPQVWTWDAVKDRFQMNNTTLLASRLNIDELKAQEITAHLPPNPDFTLSADGTQITPSHGRWTPFAGTFVSPGGSYLFERRNKRGLRLEAAQQGTAIGIAQTVRLGTHVFWARPACPRPNRASCPKVNTSTRRKS